MQTPPTDVPLAQCGSVHGWRFKIRRVSSSINDRRLQWCVLHAFGSVADALHPIPHNWHVFGPVNLRCVLVCCARRREAPEHDPHARQVRVAGGGPAEPHQGALQVRLPQLPQALVPFLYPTKPYHAPATQPWNKGILSLNHSCPYNARPQQSPQMGVTGVTAGS